MSSSTLVVTHNPPCRQDSVHRSVLVNGMRRVSRHALRRSRSLRRPQSAEDFCPAGGGPPRSHAGDCAADSELPMHPSRAGATSDVSIRRGRLICSGSFAAEEPPRRRCPTGARGSRSAHSSCSNCPAASRQEAGMRAPDAWAMSGQCPRTCSKGASCCSVVASIVRSGTASIPPPWPVLGCTAGCSPVVCAWADAPPGPARSARQRSAWPRDGRRSVLPSTTRRVEGARALT